MQHFDSLRAAQLDGAWLTIGAFDGVHVGHQTILSQLAAGAQQAGAPAVLLTFHPHPRQVLGGAQHAFYLSGPQEKVDLVAELGLDAMITHPFTTQTAQTTARDFVGLIHKQLGLKQLWVGRDFALGHNRVGDVATLQRFGQELGFGVHVIQPVEREGEIVSSSRIRRLLGEGDVEGAKQLLGRPYRLSGRVASGAGRGHGLGIPTANLLVAGRRVVPASGVYAGWAALAGRRWGAVTNIGVRPTFEDRLEAPVVETHLLDYDGEDFYDRELQLDFAARLRAEQRFSGVDELLAQIRLDIEQAREILNA